MLQLFGGKCVAINIEGNIITEIRGYSHIIVDRYYKGLTIVRPS